MEIIMSDDKNVISTDTQTLAAVSSFVHRLKDTATDSSSSLQSVLHVMENYLLVSAGDNKSGISWFLFITHR